MRRSISAFGANQDRRPSAVVHAFQTSAGGASTIPSETTGGSWAAREHVVAVTARSAVMIRLLN